MSVNYTEVDSSELEFFEIGSTEEIPNGERLFIEIGDINLVIFNIAEKLFAIGDICPHDGGPLGEGDFLSEHTIACPRHGANFEVTTGAVLTPPAVEDIPVYPVRIVGNNIEVGLPLE